MEFTLLILLTVAVILLWSRVASLTRKVDQLQDSLAALRRAKPEAVAPPAQPREQTPASSERAATPAPAGAAAPAPSRPSVWNPQPVPAPPQASRTDRPSQPTPSRDSAVVRLLREYFTGGNLVVRVGVIVLFFGVAFLLKYAAEHAQLSIRMRLTGVALGAAGLFALGWRLRLRRHGFALALQGGGPWACCT